MSILSIIIPVYNEKGTIREVLAAVENSNAGGLKKEIILVDDGSTDSTRELLKSMEKENKYRILYHEKNKGKGAALKSGFKEANGDFIVIQDADLEYDPRDYSRLLEPVLAGRADVVFGSRNLVTNNVPFSAVYFYGGRLSTKVFNLLFGTKFTDIHTCYKLFPKRFVPPLLHLASNDFVYDAVELTYALAEQGKITEVPISYRARRRGQGKKLSWRDGVSCLAAMLRLRCALDRLIRFFRYRAILRFVTGESVLDVGCGPSFHFLRYIQNRIRVGYGIDKKARDLRLGNLAIYGCNLDDAPRFPLPDASVEQVFLLAVLEHLLSPEEVLGECYRVLAPGGKICLTTPTPAAKPVLEFLAFRLHLIDRAEILDHKHYFSRQEFIALLERTGFKDVRHRFFELGMNQFVHAVKGT